MSTDWNALTWLNPPRSAHADPEGLHVTTGHETDFWQKTYYGFHHDSGHFLHLARKGEFTVETRFSGHYETLYDQAGLMVRHDENNWLKCGIEFTDGFCHLSTVVTVDGSSDWSAFALEGISGALDIRVSRLEDAMFVQYRVQPAGPWRMARLAYFPPELEKLNVGVMACSPQRAGFKVVFHHFTVSDPVSRDIH